MNIGKAVTWSRDAKIRRTVWMVLGIAVVLAARPLGALSHSAAAGSCTGPRFVAPDRYSLAENPIGVAAADMTGDGLPDVVTILDNGLTHAIAVLPGKADGSFDSPITTELSDDVILVTTGDFNGDGKMDVVVVGSFYSSLRLLLGNGDGTFQNPIVIGRADTTSVLTSADLNGDGHLDVVEITDSWIQVFLGNGDGSFNGPFRTPVWSDDSLAIGDVDGDGIPDAAGPRSSNGSSLDTVVVYKGRGDGTFDPSVTVAVNVGASSVHLADLDGDGKLDVASVGGFRIWTALGHGDGTFDAPVQSDAGPVPWRFSLGDFNGDGIPDVALSEFDPTGQYSGPYLQILIGLGGGAFTPGRNYVSGALPRLTTADFGNDGHQDIALINETDSAVFVYAGNGDATFQGVLLFPGGQLSTTALVTADFNEDGKPDLGELVNFDLSPLIFSEITTSDVARPTSHEYDFNGRRLSTLAAGDFNGDGHVDMATVGVDDHTVLVLPGNGDGTFGTAVISPGPDGAFFSSLVVGDFNGDGHLDLAAASRDQSQTVGSVSILLGNGDGTFRFGVNLPLFAPPYGLVATDLDNDGHLDLAVIVGGQNSQLLVLRGLGDGTFEAAAAYTTDPGPAAIVAADFNGDGLIDLAVGTQSTVDLFWNFGGGTFGSFPALGQGAAVLAAADFDGDGHVDLASSTSLWPGLGDGTFAGPFSYETARLPSSIVVADLDGNGLPDAAVGDSSFVGGGVAFLFSVQLRAQIPSSLSALVGESVSLQASGAGPGFLSYQWRKNGAPLSDGGAISGSHTATLTINPAAFSDAGLYDVVVTDSCASVTSNTATLSVEFADVPRSSIFHDDIIAVATAGITAGCGGSNYCPANPVRRDQMAVFLLKSKHGPSYLPPACTGVFADVACPGPFTDWVERLAAEGITGGCGGSDYCPGNPVTRAQMAVFLLKTSLGAGYVPPPATGIFGDVPVGSFAADFIEDLYHRGITGGCSASPLLYCPNGAVNRGQMAALLVKTFFP